MLWEVAATWSPYGVNHSPKCPLCGDRMRLNRRTPHQGYAEEFEVQPFTCDRCDIRVQRTIDEFGSLDG
jgi:hypothetical protein